MDNTATESKQLTNRPVWRDGGLRRVGIAATLVAATGAAYASFRQFPPPLVLRATASCFILSAPLFTLREVVAASFRVDGPVASTIVGGFAGCVGALAVTSASWKAVSHGAMVVGVGAGLFDAALTNVDLRRKAILLRWHDAQLKQQTCQHDHDTLDPIPRQLKDTPSPRDSRLQPNISPLGEHNSHSLHGDPATSRDWPVWLPDVKRSSGTNVETEYRNLVESHRATTEALQEEQARIARLLATIEKLKSTHSLDDASVSSSSSYGDNQSSNKFP